jgi:hypothetical protein
MQKDDIFTFNIDSYIFPFDGLTPSFSSDLPQLKFEESKLNPLEAIQISHELVEKIAKVREYLYRNPRLALLELLHSIS